MQPLTQINTEHLTYSKDQTEPVLINTTVFNHLVVK